MTYHITNHHQQLPIINLKALEQQFVSSMHEQGHDGEADFIVGGAGDELTLRANTEDFDYWQIVPSVMNGLYHGLGDTTTTLLGQPLESPIIIAPSAAHGLVHREAEKATLQGAKRAGSLMTISHFSNEKLLDIHSTAPDTPWFYHYDADIDEGLNQFLLNEAVRAGAKAIVVGVFGASFGRRESDLFNQFDFPIDLPFGQLAEYTDYPEGLDILSVNHRKRPDITPDKLAHIKEITGLPVIVKGIQNGTDAIRAMTGGADAIWISNTGGRQLDGARSTIESLPEIAQAVQQRVPIIFDSGIRRGQHIFKALDLGADIVALGRPVLYGLHLGGAKGVDSVIQHLRTELVNTMLLAGVQNISQLKQHARLVRQ
jgi:isopentenyl diphosphate isomerase/L-lactate dehydrogenase-like FMN-dependent dehydrogenase